MPADLRDALEGAAPRRVPDLDFDEVWRRHRRARAGRIVGGIAATAIVVAGSFGLVERVADDARPLPADDPPAEPGRLPASPDDWVRVQPPVAADIESIATGGPGLVAVGSAAQMTAAWTSVDGEAWERVDLQGSPGALLDIARTPAGMIAVGHNYENDGDTATVWRSADGVAWSHAPGMSVFEDAWLDAVVAGGPGIVVAGTLPDGPQVWYSTDGVSWDAAAVPTAPARVTRGAYDSAPQRASAFVDDVAVIGDRLALVGSYFVSDPDAIGGDRTQQFVWTSPDGVDWQDAQLDEAAFPADTSIASITSGPGGGVAVGWYVDAEMTAAAWRSADGLTWQRVAAGQDAFSGITEGSLFRAGLRSLAATESGYVAVGDTSTGGGIAVVLTSVDGLAWTRVADAPTFVSDGSSLIRFVMNWGSRFVAVGEYDDRPALWISD